MKDRSGLRGAMRILAVLVPAASLLGACATTNITSSANPSHADVANWADYASLPVELHGVVPGRTKAELASLFPAYHPPQYAALGALPPSDSGRRMVLFVNPVAPLDTDTLCAGRGHFERGVQQGGSAFVEGALCEGTRVISTASARVLTQDMTPKELAYNFAIIRDQLYQTLFPGANNPGRYYD